MIGGDHGPDGGQGGAIGPDTGVAPPRRQAEQGHQRIHADPLVPAQPAGREVGHLGEVEAAGHGHGGHGEGERQGRRPDGGGRLVPGPGQAGREAPAHGEHDGSHHGEFGDDSQQRQEQRHRFGGHESRLAAGGMEA